MPDIFISYRREDSSGHAGRLFDGIRDRFGDESVFMDVTDIRPGDDFVTALDAALALCGVVLVVIGPQWLMCTDASGRRRLDDPGDHLRIEIAHALHGKARVIPVLVRGARMPAEHELPDDLKALVDDARRRRSVTAVGRSMPISSPAPLRPRSARPRAPTVRPPPSQPPFLAVGGFASPRPLQCFFS